MRNALHGRWALRRSLVFPSRLVPHCRGWRRSTMHSCSLRSSCAPLAEGLHHTRSPITTVPHRPASSGRRVASALIACGEIELALLLACSEGGINGGSSTLRRCSTYAFLPPFIPPSEHANSTPSRRGLRRAVRAPVGDAAAPSRCGTRSTDGGRPASRSSPPAGSCLRAMGGAAAQGACAAWAARAHPWRRTSAARDDPAPQLCTAPPRPADASRPR